MKTMTQAPKSEARIPKEIREPKTESGVARWRAISDSGLRASFGLRNSALGFLLALSALLYQPSTSFAQYAVNWYTIAGGGGTCTGGVYSISGTIGQPVAGGPTTNSQYSITTGFWVLPTAVQVTGAPTLTIVAAAPGQATISWAPATPGFVLQEATVLSPANWTNSPSGATNPIVVPATKPTIYYRLFKP